MTLEDYLEPYLQHLNSIETLAAVEPRSVSEIGHTVVRLIPDLKDWARVPKAWFVPFRRDSYTNSIARRHCWPCCFGLDGRPVRPELEDVLVARVCKSRRLESRRSHSAARKPPLPLPDSPRREYFSL